METGLLHLHNLLRYAVIILLIINLLKSFNGWFNKKEYMDSDNKMSLFLMIAAHIQLLLGFGLYFMSSSVELAMADFGEAMKLSLIHI